MDFNGNLEMNGITKERKYRNQKKKRRVRQELWRILNLWGSLKDQEIKSARINRTTKRQCPKSLGCFKICQMLHRSQVKEGLRSVHWIQ